MSYTVDVVKEFGHILAVQHGDCDARACRGARREVWALLQDNGLRAALFDLRRVTRLPPLAALFDCVSEGIATMPAGVAVALLAPPALRSDAEFLENVAQNRGLNQRAFEDETAALAWLQTFAAAGGPPSADG